jgi:glycosyltransferase involved in cell wall biosynthesis
MEDRAAPNLSVIVPVTSDGPVLARCLAAIDAAVTSHDEVIVVKDALFAGPASARNRGAATACHPILVFVDADVEIDPEAFALIRARFAADSDLVAVFGSYDDDPEERDVVSTFRNLLHHYVHQGAAGSVGSFWAGLGAVRRAAFEEVGGFNMQIARASIEDIEFGARLTTTGRIQLDPTIQGKHLKRWTLFGMVHTDLAHRGVPWTRLALRGRATRGELNLSWRHRVSAASSVAIVVSAARRRPATAIASLGLLYTINQRFYRLLASRGRRYAFSGVGLHIIHHLTGTASLVVGVLDPALLVAARNGWRRRNGHALMATVDVPETLHTNGQTFTHAVDELGLEDGLAVTDNDPETRDASVAAA